MIVRKKLNKLPNKNFVIHFDKEKEEYYGVEVDEFTLPEKIYGDYSKDIQTYLKSFNTLDKNLGILLAGYKGCVDSETEYFNGREWKKISEYKQGEKVLQYNSDGTATLVKPLDFIKNRVDYFYQIRTKYGIDQMVSPEHRVIYLSKADNIMELTAEELFNEVSKTKSGTTRKVITTFNYVPNSVIDEDEDLLRVYVMIQADGHYPKVMREDDFRVRVRLKKESKKQRIEYLLNKVGIDFNKVDVGHQKNARGFHEYTFRLDINVKTFPSQWYNLSKSSLEVIYDELKYWDSNIQSGNRKYRYSTNNKQNADFVQFLFTTLGYRSVIIEDSRHHNTNYTVLHNKRITPSLLTGSDSTVIKDYNHDGFKYCFSVPSGMLVLRRNGRINITGNSGKTLLAKQFMTEANLPVLIVEEPFAGSKFNDFINSINQEVVVFFDEFEKVYKEQEKQEELLTLFDGVINSKKIFLLTANRDNINEFFENRPSRIKYLKDFKTVDKTLLQEIMDDLLEDSSHEEEMIDIVNTLGECGKDLIISLIEEVNMSGENPLKAIKRMNIKIPDARYDYVAYYNQTSYEGTINYHPLSKESLKLYLWKEGGYGYDEYDEYVSSMKIEKYEGEIHMTDKQKNKFKFYKQTKFNALENL